MSRQSVQFANHQIDLSIYFQGAAAWAEGLRLGLSDVYELEADRALWRKGWEDASKGVSDPPAMTDGRTTHQRERRSRHEMSMPTYIARCVRSGEWWAVDIADASGTHLRGGNTQARNLAEAEDKAREVIALLLDIPEDSFNVQIENRPE